MNDGPKILTLDLEVSPLIAYSYGPKWETNLIEVIEQSQVMSFSAKWYRGQTITKGLHNYKGYKPHKMNDKALVREVRDLLDECEILIGQNSDRFDLKVLNTRFLYHGIPPPSPYKTIDTLKEARKYLRLPSYALDDLGSYFGIGRKTKETHHQLWKDCIAGNKKAWKQMLHYNENDTILTERLFNKLKPYIKTVNLGIWHSKTVCPRCGSRNLRREGYNKTLTKTFRKLQCKDCLGWCQEPIGEKRDFKPHKSI